MAVLNPLRPLAALALVVGLAACTSPDAEPSASPSPTPSATATAAPTEPSPSASTPAAQRDVEVWYLTDTRAGFRLARELRTVPSDDAVAQAVALMVAGPTDPDYATTWDPGTRLLGVTEQDGVVVVDLSADARTANAGSEAAALMVQQLVHTVTGALGDLEAPVLLTIEGEAPGDLWGVLRWDDPVTRAAGVDVRLLVQIDEPREGATLDSPVTVTGEAAVFEATLGWTVLAESGAEVASGFTMTSEGQTFAPYAFTVELGAGTWTIVVTEDDPSDGEGGTPMSDSRTVTVG